MMYRKCELSINMVCKVHVVPCYIELNYSQKKKNRNTKRFRCIFFFIHYGHYFSIRDEVRTTAKRLLNGKYKYRVQRTSRIPAILLDLIVLDTKCMVI